MKEVVILANGDYPTHSLPLGILNSAKIVICCDGAAETFISNGGNPALISGDMDSLSPEIQERFSSIIRRSSDQENNDLTKAFETALEFDPEKIVILGATGKREDHTIGNVSLLARYKSQTDATIEMYTDYGVFTPVKKSSFFHFKPGTQISIFSLSDRARIVSKGLKYPTSEVIFDSWWKATLNEVENSPFYLEFERGDIIIFAAY